MRVLWVGDAVVSSGFSRCTHAVCDALYAAGHEVAVLGINYWGDPHPYPYSIFPCFNPLDHGRDSMGQMRLPFLIHRLKPDVVVLLNDPWNVEGYFEEIRKAELDDWPPIVGWLAVDANNIDGRPLNELAAVATWTEWASAELARGGYKGPNFVVPLGVDHSIFYPVPRAEARHDIFGRHVPDDVFLVGVVGRNQPRKRLDLTISYFAEWVDRYEISDAYLYLHIGPTGDIGVDIDSLIKYNGLHGKKRVIIGTPDIGYGVSNDHLRNMFSSFDVYLTTSQGEGWGLPALEAMACGVPVIAPDWSGMGSWARGAASLVPCTSTAMSAPLNGLAYTIGGVPDRQATIWALHNLYSYLGVRQDLTAKGLECAARYPWSRVGVNFLRLLEQVVPSKVEVAPCLDT